MCSIHQKVVIALAARIHQAIEGTDCEVYAAPFDVRLPDRDEADEVVTTVVQPDIAVICDPAKLDNKGCRGTPDWIIEVLSPATPTKDQIQNAPSMSATESGNTGRSTRSTGSCSCID